MVVQCHTSSEDVAGWQILTYSEKVERKCHSQCSQHMVSHFWGERRSLPSVVGVQDKYRLLPVLYEHIPFSSILILFNLKARKNTFRCLSTFAGDRYVISNRLLHNGTKCTSPQSTHEAIFCLHSSNTRTHLHGECVTNSRSIYSEWFSFRKEIMNFISIM